MHYVSQYSATTLAHRFLLRAWHYVRNDPLALLALAGLLALAVLCVPGVLGAAEAAPLPDQAAEQYMRAIHERDPQLLHETLSPELREALALGFRQHGPDAAAAMLDEHERQGHRVHGYELVARYEMSQGGSVHFYVAHVTRGGKPQDEPYTLTVGRNGKVTAID